MTASGDATRPGPGPALERLIDFVNTNEPQIAQDRLRDPEQTRNWLAAEGFEAVRVQPRRLGGHHRLPGRNPSRRGRQQRLRPGPDAVAALHHAIGRLGFTVRAGADAHLEVAATTTAGRALAPSPAPS